MKKIELTQGQVALVDDEDYDMLKKYHWNASYNSRGKCYYAYSTIKNPNTKTGYTSIKMHRLVLGIHNGDKMCVDHINHDTLDNRKSNLRAGTQKNNMANMKINKKGTSKYKGVSWQASRKKWVAQITVNYKCINLGRFESEIEAAKAYNKAAKRHFGEFCLLNKM